MAGIFIASTMPRSGKSLITFSLGVLLQKSGYSVGYMKPLGNIPQKKDELPGDADALVVQEILGQDLPADIVSPVMLPTNLHALAIQDCSDEPMRRIAQCYEQISENKQVTLVAGTGSFPSSGRVANVDGFRLFRELGLHVLLVERYTRNAGFDALLLLKDMLGDALLGMILNAVPDNERRNVHKILVPWLEDNGIAVHGIIGQEPGLTGMRVSDLAIGLDGSVVAASAHGSRMVSGFIIGTMQVDNFMLRMRRRTDYAVIVSGDRSDLQLAAIHAKVPCVILTGNLTPAEFIRSRAEVEGVTLVVARDDSYSVARSMSRILKAKKIHDLTQIRLGIDLVSRAVDLQNLMR